MQSSIYTISGWGTRTDVGKIYWPSVPGSSRFANHLIFSFFLGIMASKAQSGRLDYLYEASHAVFATCPSLSRFYMSEFQQCLEQQGTAATKLIARSACPKCGQIYAPGLNCTVDLEPLCKKRRRSKKNRLVYECGACHHKYYLQGSQPAYVKSTKMDDEDTRQSIPASSSAITTTTTTISKKTPSGSPVAPIAAAYTPSPVSRAGAGLQDNKKKKKPKKNSLQAMLANRKQNEKQASSSSGLGLDDFLSSL